MLRLKVPADVELATSFVTLVPLLDSLSTGLISDTFSPCGKVGGRLRVTVPLKLPTLEIVMLEVPETVTLKKRLFGVGVKVKSGVGTISSIVIEFGGSVPLVPVMLRV